MSNILFAVADLGRGGSVDSCKQKNFIFGLIVLHTVSAHLDSSSFFLCCFLSHCTLSRAFVLRVALFFLEFVILFCKVER